MAPAEYEWITQEHLTKALDYAEDEESILHVVDTCEKISGQYRDIIHEISKVRQKAKVKLRKTRGIKLHVRGNCMECNCKPCQCPQGSFS